MDVFDQIIAGELPAEIILRTDTVIAFLDARPLFPGHTLICPIAHHETIYDLPEDLYFDLLAAARRVGLAQKAALGADGHAKADFVGPFGYGDQHDIHNPDAADDQ